MALFPASALRPGVRKREVFGWAMYDFANSGYTTVVITAVFAAYFVGGIAKGAPWATFAWTAALSTSYAIVMLTMPAIGAWADLRAAKKRVLVMTTTGCVLATAALALTPGFAGGAMGVALAMALVIVSNAFYSYGESLTGAFLPELATAEGMGKVSGWGWAFGYVGGMLALGLCLAYVLWSQAHGLPAAHFVPVTMLITAAIYGVAACVTFALLPERAVPQASRGEDSAWRQLRATFQQARAYRDFMWLLVCTVCYQGGVAVAITLAAIYAEQVIGFVASETMALIFVLNVAAALGAFAFGYVQDRIGHKVSLAATLLAWIAVCVIAAWVTTKGGFWWAAAIAGLAMGSSQSAGRAMTGYLAPPQQLAEFFGLWTFATRLASIIGPLSFGAITWATGGDQRIAILSTAVLFVGGLLLLLPIDMQRGRKAALQAR
ncbi:UMF1 family MFS transporter [Variovorax boronicumulans]|uniref:UMF1 family MFS transporter n=1 Tax=Variovorax boronicumulans TaxID=436515 RepID=A0AAW8DX49_9BURK|nr:MFS transporter [Variovorax boronicumulans]MDP9878182.1 UMF1 family MFS transporter [Variovorax boronicumulans]MDP9915545.1 UMF1 family MFS transporter [Variovorax boronicumulans]MDP9923814.1 UMF1 family MFS transporter [Variovorax boronicumulans]PBI93038.1 Vacuole effluxer Atg22 like protein [Variovorax boronicumulans]